METKLLIGLRIRELRKKADLSQEAVAEKAGITSKHLSSIERGKENPTIETYLKLSSAFDVDLRSLFEFGHLIKKKELRNKMSHILRNSTEDELRLYLKIINSIKK